MAAFNPWSKVQMHVQDLDHDAKQLGIRAQLGTRKKIFPHIRILLLNRLPSLMQLLGYIAMYATLASRDADCCLIPELPFYLEGPGGLFDYIEKRLEENGHMVIVIAEGAGQQRELEA